MEDQFDNCEYIHIHEEEVEKVIKHIPSEDKLYNLSDLFKVFGDKTRIKILYALSVTEMCVCDLAQLTQMTQSAISHQLKTLNVHLQPRQPQTWFLYHDHF